MSLISVLELPSPPLPPGHEREAAAVLQGLSAKPKYLPSWLFYDAEGSRLFEAITHLPEYYLTSRELSIFSAHAEEMLAAVSGEDREPLSIVELGAGSASKTLVLLRSLLAMQNHVTYVPIDVSRAALEAARTNVHTAFPAIEVLPICSEITHEERLSLPQNGRRLALYIGSSIGNFAPEEAVELLQWLHSQLEPGDALLLGTDMVKSSAALRAAYNDKAGVTAAFNKNVLARLNRELGADFSLDTFEHRAIWNPKQSRMEMHLDSRRNQTVHIPSLGNEFSFQRGESIHTENSYKFTPAKVQEILEKGGFSLENSWYDRDHWFGVHLGRVIGSAFMLDEEAEEEAA